VGTVQGLAEAMPSSWSTKVDGGPDLLQWSDSIGEVYDRCGCRRYTHEQDGTGGIQLD